MLFNTTQSIVTIPGFTYLESVKYAARLRLSHLKVNVSIDNRVQEVLTLMGLRECQHRVIPEFPPTRGELGRDLRLLSIAIEIVTLPPLIIIDDPVLSLEPGVANKLFERLRALTDRGHVVLCNIPKLNPLLIPHFQDVVVRSLLIPLLIRFPWWITPCCYLGPCTVDVV